MSPETDELRYELMPRLTSIEERLSDLKQQFGVMQDQAVEFDNQTANQIDRIDFHAQGLEQEVWKKLEALDKRVEKLDDQIAVPTTAAETATTVEADAHELIYSLFLEQFSKVTSEDYSLMAHAVGVGSTSPFQRNYFSASPSSANDERWTYLCEQGLATVVREPDMTTWPETTWPDRLYALTRVGKAFVLAWKSVKVSRLETKSTEEPDDEDFRNVFRAVSDDTAHLGPFTTVRACRICGVLISGGPTACMYCAKDGTA